MNPQLVEGIIKTPELEFDENCGGVGNVYYNSMKIYRDRIALINAATEEFYTYTDLLSKCISTALALQKQGYKKQDLIAVCSNKENLHANVPIIAGQFLGLITFNLDPLLSVDECVELLEQVEPKMIFVIEEAKNKIIQALKLSNAKPEVVSFGMDFEKKYLIECDDMDSFKPVSVNNFKETCIIHFSSGSTGSPKPICLSHYYLLAFQYNTNSQFIPEKVYNYYETKPIGPVSLGYANWYWVSTSFELMMYVSSGGCRILRETFDPQEIWKFVDKYSITNLVLTPLQCVELSMTTRPKGVDISSVAGIFTGGYTLHKDYLLALRNLFPDTRINQVYGMTECGLTTTFNGKISKHLQFLAKKPTSCGLPVSGLYYKVIDMETGKKCGPNQPGELYLKGKKIFNGFYNRNASKNFDEEGFFRTGDLVLFDEDFCFYILDRIKSILGYKDWLIYPCHIEKVLLEHQAVYDAIVIGIPHKIDGERLMGVVILKENAKITEDELLQYVNAKVEDHKRLRKGIKFMKQFPLTITGKVSRIKIKKIILKDLAA